MNRFFRTRYFWLIFSLLSLASAIFTYKYFSTAFPIVSLNLKMDRHAALEMARKLAQKYGWGPENYYQATSFQTDSAVKTFVELEAGGKQALAQMLKDNYYKPYTWNVRHFKEFEQNETNIKFTPEGEPYGFIETITEDAPGAALTPNQAQLIAEQAARDEWDIDITAYTLIEKSKEERPSKRIDHTFVYERSDVRIGDGYYRLNLTISGNKLTGLTHFVKIPEEFLLRYQEMRSANNSIALTANLIMMLLLVIGGSVIGSFILLHQHWLIWRTPIFWGSLIAFLQVALQVNELPLLWMSYDTAISTQNFLFSFVIRIIFTFIGTLCFYSLVFMAAESLTRRAFGNHIRLWNIWSGNTIHSFAIFGRTVGGYLLVPCCLAFVVLFYLFTTNLFGWWYPSEALINPNILASYFPWLSSIGISLGAGFMEESLFRAVPLACAALLGNRFGNRKNWIIAAFILQIIIFGAAHANYPAQPAYARLIELIGISSLFGGLYLSFGLLPAIITHFLYDVVWLSLPLFVSGASGAWFNQFLIIILSLAPLLIVLRARLKKGSWTRLKIEDLNKSWKPTIKPKTQETPTRIPRKVTQFSPTVEKGVLSAGLVGCALWLLFGKFTQEARPLRLSKTEAVATAKAKLEQRGISLAKPWQSLPLVVTNYEANPNLDMQHRFVWQQGGSPAYKQLLGTYLQSPYWHIRFARFEGEVSERAEEYQVSVADNNNVFRFIHKLPETAPGKELSENQARKIAHEALQAHYNLSADVLQEISAQAKKHPERKDWIFTFADKNDYPLETGQARIAIIIAGDEIADTYRFIHVPEEWERSERNDQMLRNILKLINLLLLYLLVVFGLFFSLKQQNKKVVYGKLFFNYFLSFMIIYTLLIINAWPTLVAQFNTSEPFTNQAFSTLGIFGLGAFIKASVLGIMLSFIASHKTSHRFAKNSVSLYVGISIGAIISGVCALIKNFIPPNKPLWADYSSFGAFIPTLSYSLVHLLAYISLTILMILILIIIDAISYHWQKRKNITSIMLVLFGILLAGSQSIEQISLWLLFGSLLGCLLLVCYRWIFRCDHALVPLSTGSFYILLMLQEASYQAYPNIILATILSIATITLTAFYWFKTLNR